MWVCRRLRTIGRSNESSLPDDGTEATAGADVHRQIARELPDRRVRVLREERVAQLGPAGSVR